MSAQRRRPSLPLARYNPLSHIFSPVLSLTRIIRRTYRPEREEANSSVPSTPTSSAVTSSGRLDGINQRIPVLAPNESSHSASSGQNVPGYFPSLGRRGEDEREGKGEREGESDHGDEDEGKGGTKSGDDEDDETSDLDYVPPSSSDSSTSMSSVTSLAEAIISGKVVLQPSESAESASAGAGARISASAEPRSRSGARRLCTNWTEQALAHADLEPGEILEVPEIVAHSGSDSLSEPPSELAVAYLVRRVRTYQFRGSYLGGRLKFEPRLPGPPSINRWMYHPTTPGPAADTERAIGDVDFNPAPNGGLQYFVYCEAPGTNDHEYAWAPLQLGGSHPLMSSYVLYHHPEHAPFWLYQPVREEF
ncbi:hypothetical protein FRC09_016362 [Ceratobasidium sp. 395]|nr:hypothetical protein FRC09_016362 [Ceratobasidium sp. 395]